MSCCEDILKAVENNHPQCIQILGTSGNFPRNDIDNSSLHSAIFIGHNECAKEIVKFITYIDWFTWNGWTGLNIAAEVGNYEMLVFLADHGADINHITEHGYTPIYSAIQHGHRECVEFLFDRGCFLNTRGHQKHIAKILKRLDRQNPHYNELLVYYRHSKQNRHTRLRRYPDSQSTPSREQHLEWLMSEKATTFYHLESTGYNFNEDEFKQFIHIEIKEPCDA